MPQMAPINWLSLFFLFFIIFLLFNVLNYFCINLNKKNMNKFYKNSLFMNWKW